MSSMSNSPAPRGRSHLSGPNEDFAYEGPHEAPPACMPFESVQTWSTARRLMSSLSSSLQSLDCEHIHARSYMSRAVVVRLRRAIISDTFSSRGTVLISGSGPP